MSIKIKDLCKSYGKHIVLNRLNLEIPDGNFTVIFGKSGCGKTTLLNIIGHIESYDSGTILYNGKQITRRREKRQMLRNDIGFIFQDFGLLENESIYENMMLVYKIRKMKDRKKEIENALMQVNIHYPLKTKIYELSGGEQQRIAIAKILLKDPQIILADEPTASLDAENRDLIIELLKTMSKQGKTVVVVSHDSNVRDHSDVSFELDPYAC